MQKLKVIIRVSAALLAFILGGPLAGCSTTEREAAAQIDRTSEIIREATELFRIDPELRRAHIVIDGFWGDMRLKGEVANAKQQARAARLVWAVAGVKSVQNDLKVSGRPPR